MNKILCLLLLSIALFSCQKKEVLEPKLFNNLDSKKSGVDFSNILTENDSVNYFTYGYIYMGAGVSTGDINNDGLIDLFFTGNMVENKLYLNQGNLQFKDISLEAGITGDSRWYTGVTMADVNGDGFLDIYCSVSGKYGPRENQLFINNGNNTFTEKAQEYGLADPGSTIQSTFFDYDLDGDLDVYVANYPPISFQSDNTIYRNKMRLVDDVETDNLYRNDGGVFTKVTNESGLRSYGLSNSVTVSDVNNDGWPDIYISNDFSVPDYFYFNNQDGTFSEKVKEVTANFSFYGMGVDIADFNNDLLLDIFQTDMTPKNNRRLKANMASMNPDLFWGTVNSGFHYQYMQNSLQLNNGNLNDGLPNFSNISQMAGVATSDWSWGILSADLDNDGWKDLFISNGTRREINNRDYFKKLDKNPHKRDSALAFSLAIPSERIDNFVYKNNHDLTFSEANKDWGLSFEGFTNGCAYADLDNDGDLEIILNNLDDKASIFENKSSNQNNYLSLKFKGEQKNTFGLGVKVTLTTKKGKQFQELTLTRGFQSSVAPRLHFGIDSIDMVDQIDVVWPSGKKEIVQNIAANQILLIEEKNAQLNHEVESKVLSTLFETVNDSSVVVHHKHQENLYDDYRFEVLLPHKTSTFGPALAIGDLNGDGLDDMVIGGAANYETGVYFQTTQGFVKQNFPDISADKKQEDLGALIFDANGDGYNDLYIVSGGNEFLPDSPLLQDRLYKNQGNGILVKDTQALPEFISSGSRVKPFDFDGDGDLDLFVGGRLIPGNYPKPASSYILENQSTTDKIFFKNVTEQIAPGLNQLGLVTDASWSDIDQDGQVDLMLTGEWMPITVFKNTNGKFNNVTKEMGLENSSGWWFSIQEGDFDEDGDIDFIVGNLGLNYKYKANDEETFDVYYNDFDKNQKGDIVLSYFSEGEKFPLRGRECSSQQIPAIKKKFKNYETFAVATVDDVYTKKDLSNSLHYQAKTFASAYLENINGSFKIRNLPNIAQVSAINKTLVEDYDKDGHLDLLVAGNLHSSEVETPRNDASIGMFLKGNGKGEFKPIKPSKSGFFVPGDVKDMARIKIGASTFIAIAKNNDFLQFVKVK